MNESDDAKKNDSGANKATGKGRLLTRSRSDKILAGVAGGVAAYYGFKSVHVRMVLLLLALLDGLGVIIYLVAILLIPEEEVRPDGTTKTAKESVDDFIRDAQAETQEIARKIRAEDTHIAVKDRSIVWILVAIVLASIILSTILPGTLIMLASNVGLVAIAAVIVYLTLRA